MAVMAGQEALGELVKAIQAASSPDGGVQKDGERRIKAISNQAGAGVYMQMLLQTIARADDPTVKHLAAINLKNELKPGSKSWKNCSVDLKKQVMGGLLEVVTSDSLSGPVISAIASAIGNVASDVIEAPSGKVEDAVYVASQWDDLWKTLDLLSKSPNSSHQGSAMKLIERLTEFTMDAVMPHVVPVVHMVAAGLSNQSEKTRVSALTAAVSLLISAPEKIMGDLKNMMSKLLDALTAVQDEDQLKDCLTELIKVIDFRGKTFKEFLPRFIQVMTVIATKEDFSYDTRRLGCQLLVSFGKHRVLVRSIPEFAEATLKLSFMFIAAYDTEELSWEKESDEEDQENLRFGMQTMEALREFLGAEICIKVGVPLVQQRMASENHLDRYAGLMGLSKLCDGDEWKGNLVEVMKAIAPSFTDSSPMVVHAACACVGEFCESFQPVFQAQFHKEIIPLLISILAQNEAHPRVHAHAARCINLFTSYADEGKDIVSPFLPQFLEALSARLATSDFVVQEACFLAICGIARNAGEKFGPVAGAFFPAIMRVLETPVPENPEGDVERAKEIMTQVEARCSALTCVGVIGQSVGADAFASTAEQMMQWLLQRNADPSTLDTEKSTIKEVFGRIGQVMGERFQGYLDKIVPDMIKDAAEDTGSLLDFDDPVPNEEMMSIFTVEIRGLGKKKIVMDPNIMLKKVTSMQMLYQMCKDMPKAFFKYIEPVAALANSMINYAYNEDVKNAALFLIPALLTSAKECTGEGSDLVVQLFDAFFEPLFNSFEKTSAVSEQSDLLDAMAESIGLRGRPLSNEVLVGITQQLAAIVEESQERRNQQLSELGDITPEELESVHEMEVTVVGNVVDNIMRLVKLHKEAFVPVFDKFFLPVALKLIAPEKTAGERVSALCWFDDIIEHGGQPAQKYAQTLHQAAMQYLLDADEDVRQCASYGIGVLAQKCGNAYREKTPEATQGLIAAIQSPESKEDEFGDAVDNAVGAIGKLIRYQNAAELDANLVGLFVEQLPLENDEDESKASIDNLVFFLQNDGFAPLVLGANGERLPHLLKVFAAVLDTNSINKETPAEIGKIVQGLSKAMPQAFNAACQAFDVVQAERLGKFL